MSTFAGDTLPPVARSGRRWHAVAVPMMVIGVLPAWVWLGLAAGCAAPAKRVQTKDVVAIVLVENHTDFVWRVAFTPVAAPPDGVKPWREIKPREVRRVELTPGVYRVGRELVDASDQGDDGIELTLAGGRTYTWPLATLFSIDGVEP